MADVKTAAAKPSASQAGKPKNANNFVTNLLVVLSCIVVGYLVWKFVLGSASNFSDGDAREHAKNGMGTMYQGGFVVPILMATLLTLLCFVIERALTVFKAKGKVNSGEFVRKVQYHLANKNVDAALSECDKQAGSVGNVMKAGLGVYKEMMNNTEYNT